MSAEEAQGGDGGDEKEGSYTEYIENDYERAKFFNSRIKTIRAKTETFAKCTGEEVLVIAIDEQGSAHHWGTKAFEKFVQNPKVQELIFKHITEQPVQQSVLPDKMAEEQHLRATLRNKILQKQRAAGNVSNGASFEDPSQRPEEWPEVVPFCDPIHLTHEQLLLVLKSFLAKAGIPIVGAKRTHEGDAKPAYEIGADGLPRLVDPQNQNMYSMINAVKLLQQGVAAPSLGAGLPPTGVAVPQGPVQVAPLAPPPSQRLMGWVGRGPPPAQPNSERLQPNFVQQLSAGMGQGMGGMPQGGMDASQMLAQQVAQQQMQAQHMAQQQQMQ
jgi:hypothetical protein